MLAEWSRWTINFLKWCNVMEHSMKLNQIQTLKKQKGSVHSRCIPAAFPLHLLHSRCTPTALLLHPL